MGKSKEKIRESSLILAQELFSNQCCPVCGTFVAIMSMSVDKGSVLLGIKCLNEDCDYVGERELV
jgi:transcription elongation factor Elf1